MEKRYSIYSFLFKKILQYGYLDQKNHVIRVSKELTKYTYFDYHNPKIEKGSSLLFEQINKNCLQDEIIEKIIISMSFKNCLNDDFEILKQYEYGIYLWIDDEEILFKDFITSNSMSRDGKIYYLNTKYLNPCDKNPNMYDRITLGLREEKIILISKWYSYSGLVASDCTILDNIKLGYDEVVIIPDKTEVVSTNCITSVSINYLFNQFESNVLNKIDISKYSLSLSSLQSIKSINLFFSNINSYKQSINFNRTNLGDKLYELIDFFCNLDLSITINDTLNRYKQFKENYNTIDEKNSWKMLQCNDFSVEINLFDGEGLISKEFADEINSTLLNHDVSNFSEKEYIKSCVKSFQIRLPFIKGMVHICDIKEFCNNHNITKIYGKTYYNNDMRTYVDISKIKLILTESQFKGSKFLENNSYDMIHNPLEEYFNTLNNYEYNLGFKYKKTKKKSYQLNYQFLSTLPLDNLSNNDINTLLDYNYNILNRELKITNLLNNYSSNNCKSKGEKKICSANKIFYMNTNNYKKKKEKIIKSFKNDILKGKLYCLSTRKYLCSDLLELLYHAFNHNSHDLNNYNTLDLDKIYLPNTALTSNYLYQSGLVLRNPHYSRSEIGILTSITYDEERNKYFGLLDEVAFINPRNLIAERIGGADYDGDEIFFLYQPEIKNNVLHKLTKNNSKLRYPLIKIPSTSEKPQPLLIEYKIDYFKNTFINNIGKISNRAFINSFNNYTTNDNLYYNDYSNEDSIDKNSIYTILGGLEIDSAKTGIHPSLSDVNDKKNSFGKDYLSYTSKIDENNNLNINLTKEILGKYEKKPESNSFIYRLLSSTMTYKYNPEKVDKYQFEFKNDSNIDYDNMYNTILSIVLLYDITKKLEHFERIEVYKSQILSEIIKTNEEIFVFYDVMNFLNYFKKDNPSDILLAYQKSDIKYHYLTEYQEKVDYINETLGFKSLPHVVMSIITNFSNNGFMLLFLVLSYWYKDNEKEIYDNRLEIEDFNTLFKNYINKNVFTDVLDKKNITTEELEKQILCDEKKLIASSLIQNNSKNYQEEIIVEYIKKKYLKKVGFNDIYKVINNIFKCEYIFTLFDDITANYLKRN